MKKHITLLALAMGALTPMLVAQNGPPPGGGKGGGQNGQGQHRPPPSPLVKALDANHDGVIDASEIANASQALLTLDKNGDGQLTPDEYLPKPPKQGNQNQGGQDGRRGKGQNGGGQGGPPPGPPPGGGQNGQNGQGPPPPPPDGGPGGQGGPPPGGPLLQALDLNQDGVIDASEISQASKSLLTLDKNGDGKLTPDEYRPQPPQGGQGQQQNGQGRPPKPPGQ